MTVSQVDYSFDNLNFNFKRISLLIFQLRLDKPEKIKVRKAFGGHKKIKGIKIKHGVYVWNSLGIVFLYTLLIQINSNNITVITISVASLLINTDECNQ